MTTQIRKKSLQFPSLSPLESRLVLAITAAYDSDDLSSLVDRLEQNRRFLAQYREKLEQAGREYDMQAGRVNTIERELLQECFDTAHSVDDLEDYARDILNKLK